MAIKPLILRFFPKLLEEDSTPKHHERLPTIGESWLAGSVASISTTCAASVNAETLSLPSTAGGIKVTTEVEKSTWGIADFARRSTGDARLSSWFSFPGSKRHSRTEPANR